MFKKPNVKSVTSAGVTTLAIVAGAKLGDGIVAVMPDSTASFKKILVGGIALLAAASVDAKTQTAQAAQSALIGIGAKQILDEVTENLTSAVAVKDNSTITNKFINAVVGHTEAKVPIANLPEGTKAAWLGEPSQVWDRNYFEEIPASFDAATMM